MLSSLSKYQKYAWFTLAYNIFVVLFGAFVRATGSGAGCGAHWPLCNGVIFPRPERIETIIEFSHRVTSGITLILILVLVIWTWRTYTKGSLVRKTSAFALFFTITEALVGAGLVLYKLVAYNDSAVRSFSVTVHLVNTFLLIAFLALTAWFATDKSPRILKIQGLNSFLVIFGWCAMLFLGASGAITALGDTLFPSVSLAEGLQKDFSPTAHYLIRLRVYHPGIAISVGIYLTLVTLFFRRQFNNPRQHLLTNGLFILYFVQILIGIINVALLAPVWIQIIHLLFSNLVWIFFVLLSSDILSSLSPGLNHQEIHHPVHDIAG
ncbi:MAG: COX15/CtaA family protein [Anaerolineaceae bacterium]|nr:COX15/CtaA family protein [Anaerolineaceae bacterium]